LAAIATAGSAAAGEEATGAGLLGATGAAEAVAVGAAAVAGAGAAGVLGGVDRTNWEATQVPLVCSTQSPEERPVNSRGLPSLRVLTISPLGALRIFNGAPFVLA